MDETLIKSETEHEETACPALAGICSRAERHWSCQITSSSYRRLLMDAGNKTTRLRSRISCLRALI